MCYIFVKGGNQTLHCAYVKAMRSLGNRDGAGVMFVEDGRVKIDKCMAVTEQEAIDLYERHAHRDIIAMHLRNQSIGPRTPENVHPYWVTNKDWGHKRDIALMHNGTIPGLQVDTSLSDSANLAAYHLRPLLAKTPSLFTSDEFWHMISAFIGNSKLVLMNDLGQVRIVNPGLGRVLDNGIWVSSKAMLRPLLRDFDDIIPEELDIPAAEAAPLQPNEVVWEKEGDNRNHLRVVQGSAIHLDPPASLIGSVSNASTAITN